MKFFVMINSESDTDLEKDLKRVMKTDYELVRTYGVYDVIVKTSGDSVKELSDTIKTIPKISCMILTLIS